MSQLQQTTDGITVGQSVETQIYIWQWRLKFQQSAHNAEEQLVEETAVMLAETTMRFCLPGRYHSQLVLAEVNSCNTLIDCSIKHLIRNGSSLLLTTHRQERECSNEESSTKQGLKCDFYSAVNIRAVTKFTEEFKICMKCFQCWLNEIIIKVRSVHQCWMF